MRAQRAPFGIIHRHKGGARLYHKARMGQGIGLVPHFPDHDRTIRLGLQRREMRGQRRNQRHHPAIRRQAKGDPADPRRAILGIAPGQRGESRPRQQVAGLLPCRLIRVGHRVGSFGHFRRSSN